MTKIQYRNASVDGYEAKRRGECGFVIHAPDLEGVSLIPSGEAECGFAAEGDTIGKVPVTGSTLHRPDLSKLQIED